MEHFYHTIVGSFNFQRIYDKVIREVQPEAVIVEIGSGCGRSTAYMAVEIANSGKQIDFYCIQTRSADLPEIAAHLQAGDHFQVPLSRKKIERRSVWDPIKLISLPSVQAATSFERESVDFVMVAEALHYASVRDDIRAWLPKLKPNGVIAGNNVDYPGILVGLQETIPCSEINIASHDANWWHRKQRPERGHWSVLQAPMRSIDHLTYIPYVNRPDLLDHAATSIPDLWPSLVIIDESVEGLRPDDHPWMSNIAGVFRSPFGCMTFTQMMNWAQAEACQRQVEYLIFMHNDAECVDSVALQILNCARARPNTGVVFTYYDAFAVFNVGAIRDVGPWDETFGWYFSDNDYYRRMQLRNWERYNFGGDRVIHHGSQTQRSDPAVSAEVGTSWQWHEAHYRHKWGGGPGNESYLIPYNGKPW
jgi:hypothetical protein